MSYIFQYEGFFLPLDFLELHFLVGLGSICSFKRLTNIKDYEHLRSWDSHKREFKDIRTAFKALRDIEHYVFNHTPKESEYEAFLVFIRKSDAIWKHNFNDHMKKYKFINSIKWY